MSSILVVCTLITIGLLRVSKFVNSEIRESRLVQTLQGQVRGYKDQVDDVFVFYGIPYATAPTGQNRYKPPLPGPVWLTTLEAVDNSIVCPQAILPLFLGAYAGKNIREDCLIANIYTPNTNETNIPVVVIVHGGAFQLGWGNLQAPNKFVQINNVIAVTFNYRLGIHGFLCLGTEGAPGNAGLKDQLALLRWVKANIAGFGGNPNDVTLDGFSAGSASVELLMLSPATKGLFTKAIPESSTALTAYAVQTDPLENAKEFARRYNVSNVDNVFALEQFYKTASFKIITSDSFQDRKDNTFLFTPCVERKTSLEPIITESPDKIIKSGDYNKVPVLYGFDNMEGQLRLPLFLSWITPMNEKFSDFIPPDLQFRSEKEKNTTAKQMKEFYFGNKTIDVTSVLSFIDFISDIIIYPYIKASKLYLESGHKQIYLYEYSFYDKNTPPVPFTDVRGAGHTAQTAAVYTDAEDNITDEFRKMKKIMRELWGNFIKKGVPVPAGSSLPSWPPIGAGVTPYMSLGRTVQLLNGPILEQRMKFWENLHKKYYRPPSPPRIFPFFG